MGPKKSLSTFISLTGYTEVLQKLCREEDVLIIPEFVTFLVNKQVEKFSPKKSKEKTSKHQEISFRTPSRSKQPSNFNKLAHASSKISGSSKIVTTSPEPPKIFISYENPDDKDTPSSLICKNIYIEFSFVRAFKKSLKNFPSLKTLKIENCCASKEMIEAFILMLSEEPGRQITTLSLDGNENIAKVLPLILYYPTGVQYLSLQRCSLNDEDIKLLAEALKYSDVKEHSLLALDLGMNKITDEGVFHLANALRSNRKLLFLSLAGNQITDKGASYLADVLKSFQLTEEEVITMCKRSFERMLQKKKLFESYLKDKKNKDEKELSLKNSGKLTERSNIKKVIGPDGKIRCISTKDKRNKLNRKGSSVEKTSKTWTGEDLNVPLPDLEMIKKEVESQIPPDNHPFVTEMFMQENKQWCGGCWSLEGLNLTFNYLTDKSVQTFKSVFDYQKKNLPDNQGLSRLFLVPGNFIQENNNKSEGSYQ